MTVSPSVEPDAFVAVGVNTMLQSSPALVGSRVTVNSVLMLVDEPVAPDVIERLMADVSPEVDVAHEKEVAPLADMVPVTVNEKVVGSSESKPPVAIVGPPMPVLLPPA